MRLQHRNLTQGDAPGDDVRLLQEELRLIGYAISRSETVESYFGDSTYAAVIQFQQEMGIDADGEVDEETAKLLNQRLFEQAGVPTFGACGDAVRRLQEKLRRIGFDISAPELDEGCFGEYTEEALRKFQRQHDLPPYGILDPRTERVLNDAIDGGDNDPEERSVNGTVQQNNGSLWSEGIVQVYDQNTNTGDLTLLGEMPLRQQNPYSIAYMRDQLQGKRRADLVITVTSEDGTLLARVGTLTSAAPVVTADFVIPSTPELRLSRVYGRVTRANQPVNEGIVRVFHENGAVSLLLGETPPNAEGGYQIQYAENLTSGTLNLRARFYDRQGVIRADSGIIRAAGRDQQIDLTIREEAMNKVVEGRIFTDYGVPAENLTLRIYNRGFGDQAALLGELTTDAIGTYRLDYDTSLANVEVRAVDAGGEEFALARPAFGAGAREVLNLVVPASRIKSQGTEFERMQNAMNAQIGGIGLLADAHENRDRQDLSYLRTTTGWDARLLALASTAGKESPVSGIPQDALYALYRTGFPLKPLQLAYVSADAVARGLTKARDSGIVEFTDERIATITQQFEQYARTTRLNARAPGAASTYSEMLDVARLPAQERETFEKIYLENREDGATLWKQLDGKIASESIDRLKLQGKLGALTFNNAPLTAALQESVGSVDNLHALVDQNLYQPSAWITRLNELSNNDDTRLAALIPPAYAGEQVAERALAYATDMARQVRLSFPTRVVAQMVKDEGLRLGGDAALKADMYTFLINAESTGFELGSVPLSTFIQQNEALVFNNIDPANRPSVQQAVEKLQRLYQITPSDASLQVLYELGIDSAYQITSFTKEAFLSYFEGYFTTRKEAELVYEKSQQVESVTYTFFTMAKTAESTPPVFAISGTEAKHQESLNHLKENPTLESLFGELDFCECEHCRSVLSPAAYLVDLLRYLDVEELNWKAFLKDWKHRHGDQDYTAKYMKPYDALVKRRPDLPHLQLTCENTNTAMPYIDIVNEILEFYVVDGKLSKTSLYDTGTATTPELLAEPQNIQTEAYDTLREERYPLILPFNLWIETTRRFLEYFDLPFWRLLELLRPADELFPPETEPEAYYRATIFAESLGMSPDEYDLFTDADIHKDEWFTLYGYDNAALALAELKSAKTLARRLKVSYQEMVELVKTGYLNPQLNILVILDRLEIEIREVMRYKEQAGAAPFTAEERAAFEARLAALSAKYEGFDALDWLNDTFPAAFGLIMELADPDAGCSFDETTLQYADGSAAKPVDFLKLNLFVRLWRRLGWSIEDTDLALQVFTPQGDPPQNLTLENLGSAMQTALIYMAHLKALDAAIPVGKRSRQKLLSFWAPLPTTGKQSLYAQLFLTHSILKHDPVFDHPLGLYLSKPNVPLKDHLQAVQGALGLTSDEIAQILGGANSIDSAMLSLDTVSQLYRYWLLAKALKLSIHDLIALRTVSGLDPFHPLSKKPISKLEEDYPFEQTLRFIELAQKLSASGFTPTDVNYLLRHEFDLLGKYQVDQDALLGLVKTLASELRRIEAEHAAPADPAALSDDVLRQKLALVLPPDVVERFWGMWAGTAEFVAELSAEPDEQLKPDKFTLPVTVEYDAVNKIQRLTYRGVLLEAQKQAFTNANPSPVLAALLDAVQAQPRDFFALEFDGFSAAGDLDLLFAPISASLNPTQREAALRQKRERMIAAFFPFIRQRLMYQTIVQTMTSQLGAEAALVETLLTTQTLLADPTNPAQPLLPAFTAVGAQGVDVRYFDAGGAVLSPSITTEITTVRKPNAAVKVSFEGYLEAPTTGTYRFYVKLGKQTAHAELRFAHLPNPLIRATAQNDNTETSAVIELKANVPYRFTFEVPELANGDVELLIQASALAKGSLSRLTLYPASAVDRLERARLLLAKTLQIMQGFGLVERELRYLVQHASEFDQLSFSTLPTQAQQLTQAESQAHFKAFMRLVDYARLRQELAGGTTDLIDLFEHARRVYPPDAVADDAKDEVLTDLYTRLSTMTRREKDVIEEAAVHLRMTASATTDASSVRIDAPAFATERGIDRLWDVLQGMGLLGVPFSAVQRWAKPNPDEATARDLRNTVKARFEPENWNRVAQPIFDRLRQRQRDALVAYIMHRDNFSSLEKLYEHFLIDPGMEPVVQTSRLRLAISSVQLFIQRCLLNLELEVHPSAIINSQHWQWMKRYRLWEANRKIFLFPENWLEPEFRDNKSYLFQALESVLLEGDVSDELVEDAFFSYLKTLEILARLDVVTIYLDEKAGDPASNTLHVIARTFNEPYQYFYRRYESQAWTPWEPVPLEIQGSHLTAVMWRERLHLFWVTFLERTPLSGQQTNAAGAKGSSKLTEVSINDVVSTAQALTPLITVDVQLHWSEYYQGEWANAEATPYGAPVSVGVGTGFKPAEVFIHASKEYESSSGAEQAVKIHLSGGINQAIRVVSKNSTPEQIARENPLVIPYSLTPSESLQARYNHYLGKGGALYVAYTERITTEDQKTPVRQEVTKPILGSIGRYKLSMCVTPSTNFTPEIASLVYPFFVQDDQHTFFVQPKLKKTTLERWEEWTVPVDPPRSDWDTPGYFEKIPVLPYYPFVFPIPIPEPDPNPLGPYIYPDSLYGFASGKDWVTSLGTVLPFDDSLMTHYGGLNLEILSFAPTVNDLATPLEVHTTGLGTIATEKVLDQGGLVLVASSAQAALSAGLGQVVVTGAFTGGSEAQQGLVLSMVGTGGLNTDMLTTIEQNFDLNEAGLGFGFGAMGGLK